MDPEDRQRKDPEKVQIMCPNTQRDREDGSAERIVFRAAAEADLDTVCRIAADAVKHMEAQGIFQWDEVYPSREVFRSDILKGQMTLGTVGDETAVLYILNRDCDEAYQNGAWQYPDSSFFVVHRLCVDPAFQGRGIAAVTLAHIEDTLRNSGTETVRLDVFTENPAALSLYRRAGYHEVGTADWRKGRFLLMEKHL